MKKITLIISSVILVLIMTSCATSKEARNYKSSVNGKWQLQTITTEGITGKIKAQILDEADFNCFVGSNWSFNQYNNLGFYEISKNGGECVAIKRNIRWTIDETAGMPKRLGYKRVDEKYRAVDENKGGFLFTIVSIDKNNMQLKSNINFEGKPASFIYNFTKN